MVALSVATLPLHVTWLAIKVSLDVRDLAAVARRTALRCWCVVGVVGGRACACAISVDLGASAPK